MDKLAIKKYAVWARRELISRVSTKALQYGISEEDCGDSEAETVNGHLLTAVERKQRRALITQIKEKGYTEVMEEVAYTWFNRFSALRFMEVNGYLPSHVRVFTDEENNFKPQIITEAIHLELDGLDMEKVYAFKEANQTDELYKYLLIVQCNALNAILPGMFQKIDDYTELLFPDNLLREGSVIEQMIARISEESFDVKTEDGQVEIIGWLYQYYISERHEEVVNISNKGAVKKDDIPAATQLFTTDWVVRYIVDNSVGRYWIERTPNSSLADELEFYVKPTSDVQISVEGNFSPESITFFDPCVGSGHFAIYAFDVLMKIYTEYGYSQRDSAAAIVEKNIYGLDIDDRAAQLAYFSVMMKACQYDRRFFTRKIQPHIFPVIESKHLDSYCLGYFCNGDRNLQQTMNNIMSTMENAKEYGSLVDVRNVDINCLYQRLDEIRDDINIVRDATLAQIAPIVSVVDILTTKYGKLQVQIEHRYNQETLSIA